MPKYVVSSTLEDPEWNNSTVLEGDVVTEVAKLKQELDGEIVIPASYQLGRTLIEHDLVDELRLVVFPVVLGAGERFFGETGGKKPMRLVDARTIGDGLAFLTYELVPESWSGRPVPIEEVSDETGPVKVVSIALAVALVGAVAAWAGANTTGRGRDGCSR